MSIPRIRATTRTSMNVSSGIVSIFTARISGGMSASSGLRCASSMSMRVSKRTYSTTSANRDDTFSGDFEPQALPRDRQRLLLAVVRQRQA
jgi:hypothetical protein